MTRTYRTSAKAADNPDWRKENRPFLLPQEVLRATTTLIRIDTTGLLQGMLDPHNWHHDFPAQQEYVIVPRDHDFLVDIALYPPITAPELEYALRNEDFPQTFTEQHGQVRYSMLPHALRGLTYILDQALCGHEPMHIREFNKIQAFRPEGLWDYVPQTDYHDYRVRAKATFAKTPSTPSLERIVGKIFECLYADEALLTVMYEPRP